MLPQQHRMRTKVQFSETTRSGVRTGRRNLVLYAVKKDAEATTIGFIVSKAVGNAVTRNKTKRRLRALTAETIAKYPLNYYIVIRALPASAQANWDELKQDYQSALSTVLDKLEPAVAISPDTAKDT